MSFVRGNNYTFQTDYRTSDRLFKNGELMVTRRFTLSEREIALLLTLNVIA